LSGGVEGATKLASDSPKQITGLPSGADGLFQDSLVREKMAEAETRVSA
jgi:hypothetical protein